MCVTIYPLVQHIPLFVISLHQAVQNFFTNVFFRVHFHSFAKKKKQKIRSLQLKLKCTICCIILLYKCQKYRTFSISDPSDDADGCGVFFFSPTDVWGPDPVKVQSPGEHGLICDESHGWFKYKIKKCSPIPNWKEKGERDKRRREVVCHPYRTFEVFFFFSCFSPPPQLFVLFLLEKCNSLLCGVKLHPVWRRNLVVFVGVNEVW